MDINLSTLVTGREVSLKDMLDAREHRQEVQRMLLSEHHLPVISFYPEYCRTRQGISSGSADLSRRHPPH